MRLILKEHSSKSKRYMHEMGHGYLGWNVILEPEMRGKCTMHS